MLKIEINPQLHDVINSTETLFLDSNKVAVVLKVLQAMPLI